jgi:hypothetical protein
MKRQSKVDAYWQKKKKKKEKEKIDKSKLRISNGGQYSRPWKSIRAHLSSFKSVMWRIHLPSAKYSDMTVFVLFLRTLCIFNVLAVTHKFMLM